MSWLYFSGGWGSTYASWSSNWSLRWKRSYVSGKGDAREWVGFTCLRLTCLISFSLTITITIILIKIHFLILYRKNNISVVKYHLNF